MTRLPWFSAHPFRWRASHFVVALLLELLPFIVAGHWWPGSEWLGWGYGPLFYVSHEEAQSDKSLAQHVLDIWPAWLAFTVSTVVRLVAVSLR